MNSDDLSLNLLFFTCYIPRKLRLRISEWEREGKAIYGWGIPFIYSAGPHVGESAFINILKHRWDGEVPGCLTTVSKCAIEMRQIRW